MKSEEGNGRYARNPASTELACPIQRVCAMTDGSASFATREKNVNATVQNFPEDNEEDSGFFKLHSHNFNFFINIFANLLVELSFCIIFVIKKKFL